MAQLGLQLQTKLQTKLALTPELKTAIELLQIPQIELEQRIGQELEDNPLLEWDDLEPLKLDGDYDVYRREGTDFAKRTDTEDYDRFERIVVSEPGLHAHLEWQVHIAPWTDAEKELALDLIPIFGPDGYLRESNEELAQSHHTSSQAIAEIREKFFTLEPVGLAAQNLKQCLLVQLTDLDLADSDAAAIIRQHCNELELGDTQTIIESLGLCEEKFFESLNILKKLNPNPGGKFRDDTADPIRPELKIERKHDGDWRVEPYKPWSHRIRRSPVMIRLQEEPESFSKKELEYIREKARIAEYFLNSLKQRELTLLRVAEAIIERQKPLLENGPSAALPLTLKDIAQQVDLHESTISRVTRRKYAITPNGILELKAFFRQSVDGQHTPEMIKEKISALVKQENPSRPLSDQLISDLLAKDEIDVARRTVAKYRTELDIPSKAARRKR